MANAGQNQNNGLHPKNSGVIFFKPLLSDPKHGVSDAIWIIFLIFAAVFEEREFVFIFAHFNIIGD